MTVMCGQSDARPTVTFPAAKHHRPLGSTKLYCLVTEASGTLPLRHRATHAPLKSENSFASQNGIIIAQIFLTTIFPLNYDPLQARVKTSLCSWPSVVDVQVQLLSDNQRGATLETVVSRMKTIHSLNAAELKHNSADCPSIRFIAISATIPNVSDVRPPTSDWQL